MNYPIWHLPEIGGGLLIAIIAIFHVVISHLAVGGGLFLVVTEIRARKQNDATLLAYVKKHTHFFVLLTMVFGGVSGVGIWFIIALVNPAATSTLIHNFVFGWAIEWVFFIGEIVALLIYYLRFDKMDPRNHIALGWLYFIFAWLSLFVINGILGFMLTPGEWIENGSFWSGFFNPSFLPALIFRTCIALIIAGVFGLVTAAFQPDVSLRQKVNRYCAKWMYLPAIILILSGIYYSTVLPAESFENLFHVNPEGGLFIKLLLISTAALFIIGLATLVKMRSFYQKITSLVLVLIIFGWMSGFEYMREIARKPYVLYDYMYSNGITKNQVEEINEKGILDMAIWSRIKTLDEENPVRAGEEIFRLACMSCHTINGYNGVMNKIDRLTERGLEAQLSGQGKVHPYMPPFTGTQEEMKALAAYLSRELNGKEIPINEPFEPDQESHTVPDFDHGQSAYVLLVWNDLGMHCISDNDAYFVFLPPANTLHAQVFKRGEKPIIVTEGIRLEYEVEEAYRHPEKQVPFWDYSEQIFGAKLEPGTGLGGFGMEGSFIRKDNYFHADMIPVTPYRDGMSYNPYPLFTVRAIDESSGEILIETRAVAPNSTEMGCRNCHDGGWRKDGVSGVSDLTAENILATHDKYEGTTLLKDALDGSPMLCQSCHEDPAVGAPGKANVLNLSSAIHGFHTNYLTGMYDDACILCHPASPQGNTRCSRGRHAQMGLTCAECHGTMEDHAISLLKNESDRGKEAADPLLRSLKPVFVSSQEEVIPRTPWLNEPDCQSCHTYFNISEDMWAGTAFNRWSAGFDALYRNRIDNHGVKCAACHGSPHAVYPAANVYDAERDNIQPIQYQGLAGTLGTLGRCWVCHTQKMTVNGHHRNMIK